MAIKMQAATVRSEFQVLLMCVLMAVVALALAGCKSSPEIIAPSSASNADSNGSSTTNGIITIDGFPDARAMAFGFYEFVPEASHAQEQALTFRIEGQPAWATFDPDSGTLTGIPMSADVGEYAEITIFASDGTLELSMPAFTIEVYIPPLVSATILWAPPTHRLDGTVLDDLAGYTISYGTSPYRFPHAVEVSEATAASFLVQNIPADRTYFFEVRAVDAFGKKSPPSQLIEVAF